jgi:lipopolysaccharide/colanic/teichoic acid biosynthesis glycosyltransferase
MNYQLAASLRADDVLDYSFAAPATVRRAGDHRHIQNEALFRRLLVRERKRADRLDQPLAVLTLAAHDLRAPDAALIWRSAIEAATRIRETDMVGWLDHHSRIGIILYDVPALDTGYARELEVRIRQELARRLPSNIVARFTIALHIHSSARHSQGDQEEVADDKPVIGEAIKRLLDILGSAALLLLLAPVLAVIAALVKLKSPGPILFRQVRIGRNMKPFKMLKFRTMHVNADPALHRAFVSEFIAAGNQNQAKDGTAPFKLVADPRVTSIGAVLRRTSLDELPQFWNVLRGEMSLVGPRPPLPYEVEQYRPWHARRVVEAKPGITGLWQVGGRSRTTFDDMVRLDLQYAKAQSFWTDIKILLATPGAVFTGKGAC